MGCGPNPTVPQYSLEQSEIWVEKLKTNGSVIIKNVLGRDEITEAKDLFWEWMESLELGIKRGQPETWTKTAWPETGYFDHFSDLGGCHSKFSWYMRMKPRIKEVYARILGTHDLSASFEMFVVNRPFWQKEEWKIYNHGMHIDQNPFFKSDFVCIKGWVVLYDMDETKGVGFYTVPESNGVWIQQGIRNNYKEAKQDDTDFVVLGEDLKKTGAGSERLCKCKAGDMILFDTRTIHGYHTWDPDPAFVDSYAQELLQLVFCISMTPKDRVSKWERKLRLQAFKDRAPDIPWLEEPEDSDEEPPAVQIQNAHIKYQFPKLTPEINELI